MVDHSISITRQEVVVVFAEADARNTRLVVPDDADVVSAWLLLKVKDPDRVVQVPRNKQVVDFLHGVDLEHIV